MPDDKAYTKSEAAEISGLTPRQVQFYTERKVVDPSKSPGGGRGRARLYSIEDVIDFRIIRHLVRFGMTVQIIEKIMHELLQKIWTIEIAPYLTNPIDASTGERLKNNYILIYFDDNGEFKSSTTGIPFEMFPHVTKDQTGFFALNVGKIVSDLLE